MARSDGKRRRASHRRGVSVPSRSRSRSVYHPSFASFIRTGVERTRARARGFLFNTQSARARGTEILSLVGIVHSFGWNAKNGTPTDGKVVRLFLLSFSSCTGTVRRGRISPDERPDERFEIEIAIGSAD